MHKIFFGLAVLFLTVSTGAYAQHSGSDREQRACSRDVSRFCRSLINQGDFTILACLKENRARLTSACRQVLTSHGQ